MRAFLVCAIAALGGAGCQHLGRPTTCLPVPCVNEEHDAAACLPGCVVPGNSAACPTPSPGPGVVCAPAAAPCPPKESCKVQEIHVKLPAPKVIIRKESKPPAAPPAPPPAAPPANEVLLVPRVVYVPYAPQTPAGPARMSAIQMVPAPPPAACPPAAPPACGSPSAPPAIPTAVDNVEELKRRCDTLERKCDALIDALNRARENRAGAK